MKTTTIGRSIAIFAMAAVMGCGGTVQLYTVQHASRAPVTGAIRYTLPRTVLQITAAVKITQRTPARYASLAEFFQSPECAPGASSGRCEAEEALKLPKTATGLRIESISLAPRAEPDPLCSYAIVPDSDYHLTERTVRFELDEQSALTAGHGESADLRATVASDVINVASRVIGSAFSLVTAALAPPAAAGIEPAAVQSLPAPARQPAASACIEAFPGTRPLFDRLWPTSTTGAWRGSFRADQYYRLLGACAAAQSKRRLEEIRNRLLESGTPAAGFNDRITRLNAQIHDLDVMFTAAEERVTDRSSVGWVRPVTGTNEYRLYLDQAGGLTAAPEEARPFVIVRLEALAAPGAAAPAAPAAGVEGHGIVYRVPQAVEVVVSVCGPPAPAGAPAVPEAVRTSVRARETVMVAQYGTLASLSERVQRSGSMDVTLSGLTGGLRRVEFHGRDYTGIAADATVTGIERIATPAATLLQRGDPLAGERSELQRLELDRSVRCLQQLGRPCADDEATPAASTPASLTP